MSRQGLALRLTMIWTAIVMGMGLGQPVLGESPTFQALDIPTTAIHSGTTWELMTRDGAGRDVPRYLASLAAGESATGKIVSPAWTIDSDAVEFAFRGHDGQGGGDEKNYVALIDARNGEVLRRTFAPGTDALVTQRWDVADLRGRKVQFLAADGHTAGAFAWLGVQSISAGPSFRVDFASDGLDAWQRLTDAPVETAQPELLADDVPFLQVTSQWSVVPQGGNVALPCGFTAQAVYLLGCTTPEGRWGDKCATATLVYEDDTKRDVVLQVGYSLAVTDTDPATDRIPRLAATADPFQYRLKIPCRDVPLRRIEIVAYPGRTIRLTGITVDSGDTAETLEPLPQPASLDD